MKYKSFARILLKVLGVYFAVLGSAGTLQYVGNWLTNLLSIGNLVRVSVYSLPFYACGQAIELGFGLYLFFGGKWVLDRIIPSNRPYCHECGYDLSHNASPQCPKCGVPTPVVERKGE
jgi:hypothetical protein